MLELLLSSGRAVNPGATGSFALFSGGDNAGTLNSQEKYFYDTDAVTLRASAMSTARRSYTMQTLLVWLGTISVRELVTPP